MEVSATLTKIARISAELMQGLFEREILSKFSPEGRQVFDSLYRKNITSEDDIHEALSEADAEILESFYLEDSEVSSVFGTLARDYPNELAELDSFYEDEEDLRVALFAEMGNVMKEDARYSLLYYVWSIANENMEDEEEEED